MYRIGALLICAALFVPFSLHADTVRVGGYRFPPFVIVERDGHSGLTLEVIEALNSIQDRYEFEFFHTSSKRRYQDHDEGFYDVILFEDMRWEWQDRPVSGTRIIARDEEVLVAHTRRAESDAFFQKLEQRRLVGMLGYHYRFADYRADEDFLDTEFNILLSNSLERNLKLIMVDRPSVAEVAIVPRSFLRRYFSRHPEAREMLEVSDTLGQFNKLRGLVTDSSPVSVKELDQLLGQLKASGRLPELRSRYNLPPLRQGNP